MQSFFDQLGNICPSCGYDVGHAPWEGAIPSDDICPSCGIQYGYDDAYLDPNERVEAYAKKRKSWAEMGYRWHSRLYKKPDNLDVDKNLKDLDRCIEAKWPSYLVDVYKKLLF